MCFFCIEGTGIEIADILASGRDLSPDHEQMPDFHLLHMLERPDPFPAIERPHIATTISQLDTSTPSFETSHAMLYLTAIVCRLYERLVSDGYQSASYQRLLTSPNVQQAITWFSTQSLPWGTSVFAPYADFQSVMEKTVFCTEDGAHLLHADALRASSLAILEAYWSWWHHPREDAEIPLFIRMFPVILLSFLLSRRWEPNHPIFAQLVTTKFPPFGSNLDMWLQRKAALHLYACSGLDAFLPYGQACRPVLLYYLVVTHHLTASARHQLKEAILHAPHYNPNETILEFHRQRHQFYSGTDHFILAAMQKMEVDEDEV